MNNIIVIPARYQSQRFPGKVLALIHGKPMLQRVYEQCLASDAHQVIVATDDERIYNTCKSFNAMVVMTRPDHPSGTSRCIEVAKQISTAKFVLNVQADEPMIQPQILNDLFAFMHSNDARIATLVRKINDFSHINDPNVVKCVMDHQNRALYFSRSPIPYIRNKEASIQYFQHIGVYGFEIETLRSIENMEASSLEQAEQLEQLRWLQSSQSINCLVTQYEAYGVDTPEDLEFVKIKMKEK